MKLAEYLTDPKTPAERARSSKPLADAPPPGGLPPLFGTLKRDFSGRGAGCEVVKLKTGSAQVRRRRLPEARGLRMFRERAYSCTRGSGNAGSRHIGRGRAHRLRLFNAYDTGRSRHG